MSAVSPALAKTITELQLVKTLGQFALGGGTNLALRYNHRVSVDIDLFTNDIIGINGFKEIAEQFIKRNIKPFLIWTKKLALLNDQSC